jgi:hypothetical protein
VGGEAEDPHDQNRRERQLDQSAAARCIRQEGLSAQKDQQPYKKKVEVVSLHDAPPG